MRWPDRSLYVDLLRHDVDVSSWVVPETYEAGACRTLYQALQHWVTHDFSFSAPHYSNLEIPDAAHAR